MKIRKHQVGGAIYTPFIYQPQAQEAEKAAAGKGGADKITGTMTKEIVDVLKENGIPNDVNMFLAQANSFLQSSKSLSDTILFGGREREYDLGDLVKIHSMANKVKFNKQLYDKAAERLTAERSWSEVAVDERGRMYVHSDEGIDMISAEEYATNRDKYVALTNSELLSMREQSPELTFNQGILNNITNAVGLESITNYVKGIIKDFGTKTHEGYTTRDRDIIQEGFRALMAGGPEGYYKVTHEDQGTEAALRYLVNALPSNMRQILKAKTAAEGGDPGSAGDVYRLLALGLTEHTNRKRSVNFDAQATNFEYGRAKDEKEKNVKESFVETMVYGEGGKEITINLAPRNKSRILTLEGMDLGTPVDNHAKSVGPANFRTLFDTATFGGVIDQNSVYMGDIKVPTSEVNRVVTTGSSPVVRVLMPFQTMPDGSVRPDLDYNMKFEELNDWIKNNPGASQLQKNMEAQNRGLDVTYDAATNSYVWNSRAVKPFFMIEGVAGSSAITNFDKKSNWITQVSKQEEDRWQLDTNYENLVNYGTLSSGKKNQRIDNVGTWNWNLYKGQIFVPIIEGGLASVKYNNQLQPEDAYKDIQNQYKAQQKRNQLTTTLD